jgi:hypothetical protein
MDSSSSAAEALEAAAMQCNNERTFYKQSAASKKYSCLQPMRY